MSARQVQRPTPIGASEYKWLGTSIVTTLALLPQQSDANLPETFFALTDTNPSRNGRLNGPEPSNPVKLLTRPFNGGLADSRENDIPNFIRPESQIDKPNVAAVQEVLEACKNGSPVEALIKAKFLNENFWYHLIAYLRMRTKIYRFLRPGNLEARLMDAYVTGVKEWCGSALDIFISQVERDLSTHEKSSEAADDRQRERLSLQTPRFYKQAVSEQKEAVDCLVEAAFKDNPKFHEEWREYKSEYKAPHHVIRASLMLPGKSRRMLLRKRLHFISWLLRNSSPQFFLAEASNLARAIKSLGGPCFLINLIQTFGLYPEDVAEYERLKKSVQGAVNTGVLEVSPTTVKLPVDLPKTVEHLSYPLSVLSPTQVAATFRRHELPPFLQVGYGVDNFKTEVINRIIKLHYRGEHGDALSVIEQEFAKEHNFHAHLFGLLRTAMRSYALVPKRSKRYKDPKAWYPHDFSAPLGKLLHAYIEGLQWWCADVHDAFRRQIDDAIHAAYELSTEENLDVFLDWVRRVEPDYTQRVKWVRDQIDPSSMRPIIGPFRTPPHLHPCVTRLRQSIWDFQWVLRHMPWDCFLFLRSDLAATLREVDGGEKGFSFLARILESLSFTERDADECMEYCADVRRHRGSR